jgi:erythromycin esterase
MRPLFVLLCLLHLTGCCFSQDSLRAQIINNFKRVNSIDPLQTDFSDLEQIGKALGDSRIVFLGEQDHGDAPTFLAKARIIKYLHEELGFDVLAFESDFFGLNQAWDLYKNDSVLATMMHVNTFGLWSRCQQAQEVYNYVGLCAKTSRPLIMTGFDSQHALSYSHHRYLADITAFAWSQPYFLHDSLLLKKFLEMTGSLIDKPYHYKPSPGEKHFWLNYIDSGLPSITNPFWKQELKNLKGDALTMWAVGFEQSNTIRDVYMANNLLWLYHTKYAGKKIIVWAHSAHIAKNINLVPRWFKTSIGTEVFSTLKDTAYIIAFSSLTGTAGRLRDTRKGIAPSKYTVGKNKKESFESWVSQTGYDYGFVDLKQIKNNSKFRMKGITHFSAQADWTKIFDGVFYIKNMYPCEVAK